MSFNVKREPESDFKLPNMQTNLIHHLKYSKPKNHKKFIRATNSIWIEVDKDIPDETAHAEFLKKLELTKPGAIYRDLAKVVVLE